MLEGSTIGNGEGCERQNGAKQVGQSQFSRLLHLWEIQPKWSSCFSWLCQPCTNNTKIAGIILVGKQICYHKKAIFYKKIFNFAQNPFDFLSSKLSRQQPSCWLGKLFQLCFIVAKSQIHQKPANREAKGHVQPLWLSACLSPLVMSVQQERGSSSALCLPGSCSVHLQKAGLKEKVGNPGCCCWSCEDQTLTPSYSQAQWEPPTNFTWYSHQKPPGDQP